MLSLPARTEIAGLTLYPDDTEFWRFYPISNAPRIRLDDNGEPMLLLLSYAVSEEERIAHPELPTGGGYLSFDTVLDPTTAELDAARQALQPEVDAEWQRLRNGSAADQARPGVAGTDHPPTLAFGTPTWTEGTVKLDAPQSDRLVSARIAAGTPSLLAGNVASFNLDLTSDGAQFMAQSLVAKTAADGADSGTAAPLQVAYDLKFWARLPPARIHMHIDSEKTHDYLRKQLEGRGIDNCTTYNYDHSDITEESLTLSSAVTVQIDTGSGSLPEEVIAQLRAYAFDTLKQIVQSTFFTQTPQPPATPAPGGLRLRPWRDPTMLLKDLDKTTMEVTLDLEQSSVVAWHIVPRTTLTGVIGGDKALQDRHVRKLALDDPFFSDITVDVEIFTDFDAIDHVEVELSHDGVDSLGDPRHAGTVLTFAAHSTQRWSIPRFTDDGNYRERHRVVYHGGVVGPWSEAVTSFFNRQTISIASPGVVSVEVGIGNVDFDRLVSSVQVTLAYGDAAHDVPEEQRRLVLTKAAPTGHYSRQIGVAQTEPVRYKRRFDLITGDVIDDDDWSEVLGEQIVINQPTESVLQVSLVPSGNRWSDVVAVFVDLQHTVAAGHALGEMLTLKTLEEFKTWRVFLPDAADRTYRYRWTASFKDGSTVQQDWTSNPGDPVLSVVLNRTGVDVVVVADALDLTASPLTEVTLTATSPPATTTLLFRSKEPQTWHLDDAKEAGLELKVSVTHYPPGQEPVVLPERLEHDRFVALPAYHPVTNGNLHVAVLGMLVDYTATPLVGVDLAYDDDPHNVHLSDSLSLDATTKTATWDIPLVDGRITTFRYRLTYYDKTGTPRSGEWLPSPVPRVVIPAAS